MPRVLIDAIRPRFFLPSRRTVIVEKSLFDSFHTTVRNHRRPFTGVVFLIQPPSILRVLRCADANVAHWNRHHEMSSRFKDTSHLRKNLPIVAAGLICGNSIWEILWTLEYGIALSIGFKFIKTNMLYGRDQKNHI